MTVQRMLILVALAGIACGAMTVAADDPKNPPASKPSPSLPPGTVVGIVVARTDKDITIKPDGEKATTRYLLQEKNAALAAAMRTVRWSNLVGMVCKSDNGQTVVAAIQVIVPSEKSGTLRGIVTDKSTDGQLKYIEVKPATGYTESYVPNWDKDANTWSKEAVAAIAGVNVGDQVEVNWTYTDRKRLVGLKLATKPKTSESKPANK